MNSRLKSRLFLGACTLAYVSGPSNAADVIISDDQTGPVATSTIDSGASGDITVESTGTINSATGEVVTIDSDNSVTNQGNITVDDGDGTTLIQIEGGNAGDFTNEFIITALAVDSTDLFSSKYGIHLIGPGDFTGNILNELGATLRLGAADSYGVALETGLIGDFTNLGTININGDNNVAVWIGDEITGDFRNRGSITSLTIAYDVDEDPETLDLFYTGSAINIGASITGGFLNDGRTKEEIEDDIEDTDFSIGLISTTGAAQALWISPTLNVGGPTDITLGPIASKGDGQGFINLGSVTANAQSTIDVAGILIEGYFDGATYTVDLSGGLRNDGSITATGISADAKALVIGEHVIVPEILNNGSISAGATGDDDTYDAIAVTISTDANTVDFINGGSIVAQAHEETGTAIGVLDTSGAISTVLNTGSVSGFSAVLNPNLSRSLFTTTAFDLTANTSGVVFTNEAIELDTDVFSVARINGDVLLGDGDDTFNFNSGQINGNVSLGMGLDYFFLGEDSIFNGFLVSEYGTASADLFGAMHLDSGNTIELDDLEIGENSVITLSIDPLNLASAGFDVGGTATVADGATFVPEFVSILTSDVSYDVIAGTGTITLPGGLSSLQLQDVPYIYDAAFSLGAELELLVSPKTAEELGLNTSLTTLYDPLREALNSNETLISAFHGILEQDEFERVMNGVLPDDTNASFQLGQLAFKNIAGSATNSSLVSARRYRTGQFWATESGFIRDQSEIDSMRGYKATGFQMAGGYEVTNGLFDQLGVGIALSSITNEPEGSESKPYKTWTTWLMGYGVTSFDRLKLSGFYGYGSTENRSNRVLTLNNLRYEAEADWSGTQHGVQLEARYRFGPDDLYIDPYASFIYLSQDEDDYEEVGDAGLALRASEFSQTGTVAEAGTVFGMETQSGKMFFTTELKLGWRGSSVDEPFTREYEFIDGTMPFTLYGPELDDSAAVVGLSVFGESNMTRIGFEYLGSFSGDGNDHRLQLVLKWRF